MLRQLRNTLSFALTSGQSGILLQKLFERFFDARGSLSPAANRAWLAEQSQPFAALAARLNASLWAEAQAFAADLRQHAASTLQALDVELGGGGDYAMLYFLTRHLRPEVVVETGVAAGYSSQAFLSALKANGGGKLYSSDFPYFRIRNPEQYIGILVAEQLRADWQLYIEGDQKNLKRIRAEVPRIDLFHYDSDKRYRGRQLALRMLAPQLAADALLLFDDIQDNSFFHDLVHSAIYAARPWHVFASGSKFIGCIGLKAA